MTAQQLQSLHELLFQCQSTAKVAHFAAEVSTAAGAEQTMRLKATHRADALKWDRYGNTLRQAIAELEANPPT
jgi:hypothetical protein